MGVAEHFEACMSSRVRLILTEGRRHTDDKTFAGGELLGQVDLIARRTFDEVDVWNGITDFDHFDGCLMEGSNRFVC